MKVQAAAMVQYIYAKTTWLQRSNRTIQKQGGTPRLTT